MRWFAGGLLYACAAFYVLAGLLGAILAMLVNIVMLLGLGMIGYFCIVDYKSGSKDCDEPDKDHPNQ